MLKVVGVSLFPGQWPFRQVAVAAREAGFAGLEVVVGPDGGLPLAAGEDVFRQAAEVAREAGLEIAAVASGLWWDRPLAAGDAEGRQAAVELGVALLDRARWLEARVLAVMPGMVSHFERPGRRVRPYAEALAASSEGLSQLVMEAEDRGVVLAVENAPNGMLLSPLEMREFIDRLHSPWVAACLDVNQAGRISLAEDWIEALEGRIAAVRIAGEAPGSQGREIRADARDVDRPAVAEALAGIGYDGPVIATGWRDPVEASQELDRLIDAAGGGVEDGS